MIVEEIDSYIGCTHCSCGFSYSILCTHQRLSKVHDTFFKQHMGKCSRCADGQMTIQMAKFKIKPAKQRYILQWRCPNCKGEWTQYEYVTENDLSTKNLIEYFTKDNKTYCPYKDCNSIDKKLIKMSKG